MVKQFTGNIEDIVQEYLEGATQKELQQKYNIGSYKLKEEIKKVSKIRRKGKDHLLNKELIKTDYLSGISSLKLGKVYGVTPETIRRCLRELGVYIRDDYEFVRQYNINDFYFQNINTKDKAYWLGWMFSDGYICRDNAFGITLNEKDRYILELFAKYLDAETYNIRRNESSRSYGLHFTSIQICQDLAKYGVIHNKSLQLVHYLPENKELVHHFIRGVFDGDGSIGFIKGNKPHHSKSLRFRICGGSYEFLKGIRDYLVKELNIPENKINQTKGKHLWNIEYGGNPICKTIYEWLYKDCDDLFLVRKKEKYDNFISTYKSLYCENYISVKHLRDKRREIVNTYLDQGKDVVITKLQELDNKIPIKVLRGWLCKYLKKIS